MAMSPVFEVGVVAFPDVDAGERLVKGLREMGATKLVNDVSILEHHPDGRFSVHSYSEEKSKAEHVGTGAVVGSLVGALVLGPFGLLVGLLGGGAVGATMGGRDPHDLGLSDAFVKELRASLPPGSSAALIAGEPDRVEELLGHVRRSDTTVTKVLREPLTEAQAAAIRSALEGQQGSA